MHNPLSKITLDIIGITAFAYDFESTKKEDNTMYNAYKNLFATGGIRPDVIIARYLGLPYGPLTKANESQRLIREKVQEIIAVKKSNSSSQTSDSETSADVKKDLLGLMLSSRTEEGKAEFDDTNLIDQVLTFLAAGHETTAVALCWTLYLLAQNPESQKQLREEVRNVLNGKLPNAEDFKNLPYLEAVAKESLRLFPPAPITNRVTKEELQLGGYTIPKGTLIFLSAGVMGRLPALWDEPDKFCPERFLDKEKVRRTHPLAWLPFLVGDRACIGQRFAILELEAILAVLINQFQFEISQDDIAKIKPKLTITMRPTPGMPLTVSKAL